MFFLGMLIIWLLYQCRKMKSRKKSPETKTAETKKSTLSLEYLGDSRLDLYIHKPRESSELHVSNLNQN